MNKHRIPASSNSKGPQKYKRPADSPDWDQLQSRLFNLARQATPSREEDYFDVSHSVMARIRAESLTSEPLLDVSAASLWERALWRAVAPCMLVTLALVAWTIITPHSQPLDAMTPLAITLEETITAPLEPLELPW
jgi:hypothetical protein